VSNLPEIKKRLDRLTQLGNGMKEQIAGLKGPQGDAMKQRAKAQGVRLGIGIGTSFFGLLIATLASLYSLLVVILLVDIALKKLWLSALIVVGGFLVIGAIVITIGALTARSSAKGLSKVTEDLTTQIKQTTDQMKAEVEELQKLLKAEAEERQTQMMEMLASAKQAAPSVAPLVAVGLLVLRFLKKRMKRRKEDKAIMRVIERFEAARAEEDE